MDANPFHHLDILSGILNGLKKALLNIFKPALLLVDVQIDAIEG